MTVKDQNSITPENNTDSTAQQAPDALLEVSEPGVPQELPEAPSEREEAPAQASAEAPVVPQEAEPAEPAKPDRDSRIPEVITARTLFFLAPDLPPFTPAVVQREYGDDEEQTTRSRNRRTRRTANEQQRNPERDARQVREEPEQVDEPQAVKGSTRLAAKRQRRRENREFGRRRTVVTESEFQARREAVDRKMLVRAKDGRVQIGVLEDNILVEHYVARNEDVSLIGNVYVGRVQNVLPSMEAAFVDIGAARNAVLYSGEVDWEAAELGPNTARKIENALKAGDRVLVQVTKDPVGQKGARLTSQISLPGRYVVFVPGSSMNGISRKLPESERSRLKKILKEVLPEGVGVIVRTAAEGATQEQMRRDVERLTKQWEDIQRRSESAGNGPKSLHAEPDVLIKIIRDVFNEDFQELIIQGSAELTTIRGYLEQVSPDLLERVRAYQGTDIFDEYRVNDMIDKALARKVWLPSGGSLVIDRTEAMTVIDVNTGKFVGSGGNLEETVTKNNLEAAEEIIRQLRLRDIGGIIVIDFIDMVLESNRDLVHRRLVEGLSRDRTKHQIAEVTSLGLVQMTRKKIGLGLLETFSEACTACGGRGVVVCAHPVGHGASGQKSSRARKRGGANTAGASSSEQKSQQSGAGGTHEITEDTRNALTKIAASTIAGAKEAEVSGDAAEKPVDQAVAAAPGEPAEGELAVLEPGTDAPGGETSGEAQDARRSRRSRRAGRSRGKGQPDAEQLAESEPVAVQQEQQPVVPPASGSTEQLVPSENSNREATGESSTARKPRRRRVSTGTVSTEPVIAAPVGRDPAGIESVKEELAKAQAATAASSPRVSGTQPSQGLSLASLDAALDSLVQQDGKGASEVPRGKDAPAKPATSEPVVSEQAQPSEPGQSQPVGKRRRRITTGPISTE